MITIEKRVGSWYYIKIMDGAYIAYESVEFTAINGVIDYTVLEAKGAA